MDERLARLKDPVDFTGEMALYYSLSTTEWNISDDVLNVEAPLRCSNTGELSDLK